MLRQILLIGVAIVLIIGIVGTGGSKPANARHTNELGNLCVSFKQWTKRFSMSNASAPSTNGAIWGCITLGGISTLYGEICPHPSVLSSVFTRIMLSYS